MQHNPLGKKPLALAVSAILTTGLGTTVAQAQDDLEEVVVTGSRIVRRDLTAPSPIMTVDRQSFQESAKIGVEGVLNQLPQFIPAGSQFVGGIQAGPTDTPGAATLNLRGLGTNRNLVLVNGRRPQPANASLAVDVNTIPSSAIANVEVITGGASAVYGPDAMAGVVNFILRDDFEGIEFDIQTGQASEGDGTETKLSALVGANSGDGRGNVMIGMDYTKRDPIFQKDRDFYLQGWQDPGTLGGGFISPATYGAGENTLPGGANPPSQAVVDQIFAQYGAPAGTVGRASNFVFNEDGTVFTDVGGYGYNGPLNCWDVEQCGPFTGIKQLANGNLDQTFTEGLLSNPMERHSVFMSGTYAITDTVSAFVQANYTNAEVTTRGGIPPAITVWQAPIPRDGRTLPADLNALLDSRDRPNDGWSLYQVLDYNGPIEPVNTNDVWQLVVGLEGELGGGEHTWEAYYSRGDTQLEKVNLHMPSLQRYQTLVAAPNFGLGGVTAPRGYLIDCPSGLPVFQSFTPDPSCVNGIDSKMVDSNHLTQDIVEVFLQGHVVDNWAGEIRYAAGATHRINEFEYQPGNPQGSLVDNPIGLFASNSTGGEIDVTEYYGELLVPLADTFDLELGYRYSDFSTAGGHDTYKALFTWGATDTITLRGGFQHATRAPNVAELFTAPTQVVVFFPGQEPCSATTQATWGNLPSNPDRQQVQDLCRAIIGNNTSDFDTQTYSVLGVSGPDGWHRRNPPFFPLAIEERAGNPNVGPEQGDTYTFGAVFNGFLLDNLTVAIDFYNIQIEDAIAPVSVSTIYDNCFNRYGTNPTYDISNSFCQLIRRNPVTGDRQLVQALFSNLGILETQGVDLQVNWTADMGPGTFGVNSTINILDSFEYQTAPGQDILDATGTLDQGGLFEYSAYTTFRYSFEKFSVGLNWRYLSSVEDAAYALNPATPNQGTGSYNNFGLTGRFELDRYSLRFGIDNLFDEDPNNIGAVDPSVDNNASSTSPGIYDVIGRTYYAGLAISF
jgi:outer membrane receptor protein involved in Fe transport